MYRATLSALCLIALASCGFSFGPVDYQTTLVLKVCAPGSPQGATPSDCPAVTTDPGTVLQDVITRLDNRAANFQGQSAITGIGTGEIKVRTTLAGAQAVDLFGATGSIAFATPVLGAPDPSNASFVADQRGRFDARQFNDELLYPPGYHWLIDTRLGAGDVTSATAGTDSTTGQITVDINFNSQGAAEWTKITNAAYAAYSADPSADPTTAQLAIFLDSEVLTAPIVTGGGQSNQTEITGNFTADDANTLATLISEGPLPAPVSVVSVNGQPESPTAP
jgi:preprotein translocase subunit SecD